MTCADVEKGSYEGLKEGRGPTKDKNEAQDQKGLTTLTRAYEDLNQGLLGRELDISLWLWSHYRAFTVFQCSCFKNNYLVEMNI